MGLGTFTAKAAAEEDDAEEEEQSALPGTQSLFFESGGVKVFCESLMLRLVEMNLNEKSEVDSATEMKTRQALPHDGDEDDNEDEDDEDEDDDGNIWQRW